jgi:hypothetical protein
MTGASRFRQQASAVADNGSAACVDRIDDTSTRHDAQSPLADAAPAQPLPHALRAVFVDVLARRLLVHLRAQALVERDDVDDTRVAQRAQDAEARAPGDREMT